MQKKATKQRNMAQDLESRHFIFEKLLEAQKARNELMKWKLILVAAIGSAGLGLLRPNEFNQLYLIIIIIPITSVYVDLLCRNLSLRSLKINIFASTYADADNNESIDIKYHKFYQQRHVGTSLESIALFWSTIFITIIITITGILLSEGKKIKLLFVFSGLLSLILTIFVERFYQYKKDHILSFKPVPQQVNDKPNLR